MHATTTTSPATRLALVTAVVASLLFVTFLVVSTSRAAFTATTDNTTNNVASGDVVLNDDDAGVALFTSPVMAPTESVVECIEVTYDGTILPASPIRLYNSGALGGTGLEQYLDVTIEVGTGGLFGNCGAFVPSSTITPVGTLQAFSTTNTAWATGLNTTWTPVAQGETQTFRFTLLSRTTTLRRASTLTSGSPGRLRAKPDDRT